MDELADELSGTTIDGDVNKDIQMKSKSLKPVNRTASIINRSKMLILSDSESDDELELNNNNSNNNNINSHNHPNNNNINNNNKNSKQLLSMKNFRISKPKNSNNNNWKSATNFMTNNNNNSSGTSVTPSFSANFNHYFSSTTTTNNATKGKRKRNSASEVNVGGGSSSSSLCSLGNMTTVSNNGLNPSATTTNHTILELGNLSNICKNLSKAKSDSMEVECDMFESSLSSNEDLTDDDDLSDECLTECNFDGDDEQSDFCDSNAPQNGSNDGRFRNRVYCHSRPKLEFKIPSRPANPFYTVDLVPSSSSSTMTVTNHHHSSSSSSPAITNLWKRRRPMH